MALKDWSTTANSNSSVGSINFAENQAPSTVNDSARNLMADVRAWYEDAEWRNWGHTVAYASATTFTISGDKTSIYVAGRPIRCTDATTLYGKVASSSYSAPDTTVTVTLDSGSLSASLTAVSLGQNPTGDPIDVSGVRGAVADTGNQTIAGNKTFSGDTTLSGSTTLSGATTVSGVATMSSKSFWFAEGADVASANDCNIWTTDGNTVHITGTTEIQDWGTAPQAGAWKWVIFDGALQLTYNATTNKLNTGSANYTTEAGDRALVYADSTSAYVVTIFPLSGETISAPIDTQTFTASGTWTKPSGYNAKSLVRAQAWGGGGSGGTGNSSNTQVGGGGGGGAYVEGWFYLSDLGATETITIGAGGAAITPSTSADGLAGGTTTIGSLVTAYGGGGGSRYTASGSGGGGGGGSGAVGASVVGSLTGGAGGAALAASNPGTAIPVIFGSLGAGATGGTGGSAPTSGGAGTYGGGGGGGGDLNTANTTGTGGASLWGGGGGGGAGAATSGAAGGTSTYGGSGGAGGADATNGTAGTQPGGGGGGAEGAASSGAGGDGKVIITVFA